MNVFQKRATESRPATSRRRCFVHTVLPSTYCSYMGTWSMSPKSLEQRCRVTRSPLKRLPQLPRDCLRCISVQPGGRNFRDKTDFIVGEKPRRRCPGVCVRIRHQRAETPWWSASHLKRPQFPGLPVRPRPAGVCDRDSVSADSLSPERRRLVSRWSHKSFEKEDRILLVATVPST